MSTAGRSINQGELSAALYMQARIALHAGISVVPTKAGEKRPALSKWDLYQHRLPSAEEIDSWFTTGLQEGLGIIGGAVSGGLEALDFDRTDRFQAFCEVLEGIGQGELLERLCAGYLDHSPNGVHLLYRCDTIAGNQKLAEAEVVDEAGVKTHKALIETRGEGGFLVIPPSGGHTHPSGKPYQQIRGGLDTIATISPEDRDLLFDVARSLTEKIPQIPARSFAPNTAQRLPTGDRPGDLYNARATWEEVLTPHGWVPVFTRGETTLWRRPGKAQGISATTNYAGSDLLYVFSSSTTFTAEHGYTKFTAYTLLNHGGDFVQAATALAKQGYAAPRPPVYDNGQDDAALPPLMEPALDSPTEEDAPITEASRFHLTDLGNAERFIDQHGKSVRYCNPWKKWLVWDGKRWQMDDRQIVRMLGRQTVRALYGEADATEKPKQRKALAAHAIRSEAHAAVSAMTSLAQMDCPIMPNELDANPWAFNVVNGTIDLRTGELGPHVQSQLISKISAVVYDPFATCPLWEDFLDRTFSSNQELLTWLQMAIGYSLTGLTREQCFFLCYGMGSNGKSTFLNVLQALLGEYGEQASFNTFLQVANETVRNDLAKLQSCRFVAAIEAEEGRRLAESMIKQITGGDPISTRFLYGEYFTLVPQFKIWLATNHKPQIRGTDHAMWRRVKLIPFLNTITEEERDEELADKLRGELSGILTWAVHGCKEWQRWKLTPAPEIVQYATEAYRQEEDILGGFLAECCVVSPALTISSAALYDAYKKWCEENSEKIMSQKSLANRLHERNFKNSKSTLTDRMQWHGLGLKVFGETEQNR